MGALKGNECPPSLASKITVYLLAKALAISPLEVYKMPQSMVKDMLLIHGNMEKLKAEEMQKEVKKNTVSKSNLR
tara:strand:+ start:8627 stop:8851 length:225 start_codon:yes stop_codon:yes gene_type:complete